MHAQLLVIMSFAAPLVASPCFASNSVNAAAKDDGWVPASRHEVPTARLPRRTDTGHERPPSSILHARSTASLAVRSS
jgi:hypothetical protein